jgi:hypothetical protein
MNGNENRVNGPFIGHHGGSLASGTRTPCIRRGLPELFTHSFPSHRDTPHPLLHLLAGTRSHASGLHRTQQSRPGQSAGTD